MLVSMLAAQPGPAITRYGGVGQCLCGSPGTGGARSGRDTPRSRHACTETLHHVTADEHGNESRSAVEYAVLDRAGRLQLPKELTEPLGMRDRVRLEAAGDHIGVWPDTPADRPGTGRPED
ncbi:MAG TPA: hypothetical protein VIK57_16255 [Streptosporangiaceae bacterium]